MRVSVLYHSGCPHALPAVELVHRCVTNLGLTIAVVEDVGEHPSPTVLVDGRDVMGVQPPAGRSCRLDVPTEDRVLHALRHASRITM